MGEWASGPGPAQPDDADDSDAMGNFPGRDAVIRPQSADQADPAHQPPDVEPRYQPTELSRQQPVPGYQPTELSRQQPVPGYQPTELSRQQPVPQYQPTELSRQQPVPGYQPTELSRQQPVPGYQPTELSPQQPGAPYVPRHQPPANLSQAQVPTNLLPGQSPANTPPGPMPPTIPPGQMPTYLGSGRPPVDAPQHQPPANVPPYQPPASAAPYQAPGSMAPYQPPGSAAPYQPPVSGAPYQASASGASSDVVRYGPGVPAAAGASQAGVTAEQVWRTGRLPEAPRRKGRMRRTLGSALTVVLLIAAGVVLFLRFHHAAFSVSSVKITSEAKTGCGVNVTGRIDTNGAAGTVSYQWVFQPQPPGQAPQPLSDSVVSGQHSVYVTVAVQGTGHGSTSQKVTLQVLGPDTGSATTSVTFSC
jgi:hypothetical protein